MAAITATALQAHEALAVVQITAATGGSAIPADRAADASVQAWTSLGAITIAEPSSGKDNIGGGTLVLRLPSGFELNTSRTPSISFTGGRNITAASISITDSNTLTVTLTVNGTGATDSFVIGGTTSIQVRPTTGTTLANGTIYRPASEPGTATISGITTSSNLDGSGGTSFGTLREVAGAASQLALQTAPSSTATAGSVFTPQPAIQVQDQFGNARTTANGSADNTTVVRAGLMQGSSSLRGTTNVTASNGTATFSNLAYNKAETIALSFTSGSLAGTNSPSILVNPGSASRLDFVVQPAGGLYGQVLAAQPVVATQDAYGNNSTVGLSASKVVTLALTAGTGTLLGTTALDIGAAAGAGTVSYSGLQVDAAGSGKQLTASATGLANGVSDPFSVTPATVTGSVTISNKVYDATTAGTIATRSLSGALGSDVVSLSGGTAAFSDKNVGTGITVNVTGLTLTGADAGNYQLASPTAASTANITPAPLTVRAQDQTRTYGGANALTATYTGFAGGETLATSGVTGAPVLSTTAVTNSPLGTYPITASIGTLAAQNYSFSLQNGTLTVIKAPLRVVADSKWRVVSTSNPTLTVSYSGFVNGETSSVLSGSPSLSTTATTSSPLGNYPITVSAGSLSAVNYSFTLVNGTLSVVPAGTLFVDSFGRAADPGALTPWFAQSGAWMVTGGVLQGGTNLSYNYSYVYLTNVWTNCAFQGQFRFPAGGYGGGIGGRLNPTNGAHYAAWLYPEAVPGGQAQLKLFKFQTWTSFSYSNIAGPMAQVSVPALSTNWHKLRLVCQGTNLAVHLDGTLRLATADVEAQPNAAGGASIEMWTDAAGYVMQTDDVIIGAPVTPTASNDSYAASAGVPLTISAPGVLTNDLTDIGNLTAARVSGPSHGTLNLGADGGFTYTASAGYSGNDSFTYRCSDRVGTSSSATVTIAVAANPPPVANPDSYTAAMNATLTVPPLGVLANDTDPNGNPLSAVLVQGPACGTLNLSSNGGFAYTPTVGYSGPDSFTYLATDGAGNSANTLVAITVTNGGSVFADGFSRAIDPAPVSPWVIQSGTWYITAGSLQGGSNAASTYGFCYLTNTWSDYSVQARVRFASGAFGGGLGARLNPATGAHYAAWVYPANSTGGSNVVKLVKFQTWTNFGYNGVSGAFMGQANVGPVGTNWHTVKLTCQANKVSVAFDGAQVLAVTDIEAQPWLSGGVVADLWTDQTPYLMNLDDVEVDLIPSAMPPVLSTFGITRNGNGSLTLSLVGTPGTPYMFQWAAGLAAPVTWSPLSTNTAAADGSCSTIAYPTNGTQRFFRATVQY